MTKQPVGECFSFIDFSMLVLMYCDVFNGYLKTPKKILK